MSIYRTIRSLVFEGVEVVAVVMHEEVNGEHMETTDPGWVGTQGGWVGIWAPANWGLGEIDGLLVPPGKASYLLTDHLYWLTAHV